MNELKYMLITAFAGAAIGASAAVLAGRELYHREALLRSEKTAQELAAAQKAAQELEENLQAARSELEQKEAAAVLAQRSLERLQAEVRRLDTKSLSLRQESEFLWRQDEAKSELLQNQHEDMGLLYQELDRSNQERLRTSTALEQRYDKARLEITALRAATAAADLRLERMAELEKNLEDVRRAAAVVLASAYGTLGAEQLRPLDDAVLLEVLGTYYRSRGAQELSRLIERALELK